MTGIWRGFFFSKKKSAARFLRLTADAQVPLDIERGPLVSKGELAKKYPKLAPKERVPIHVLRSPHLGLHGGKKMMKGYNVSRINRRNYRIWRPHIVVKSYYSDLLDYTFTVPMSTHVIREIDRFGSLDAYILYTPHKGLGGIFAINFHYKLLEIIENNLDVVLPPKPKHFPRPPQALLDKVIEEMDKEKAKALENRAGPETLIRLDYSSMAS